MNADSLKSRLSELLNAKILELSSTSGGCSYNSFQVKTERGNFFVKTHHEATRVFETEALGLMELAKYFQNIPEVIHSDSSLLILEYILPEKAGPEFWKDLAGSLAKMHQRSGPAFGFDQDNWIGMAVQKNKSTSETEKDWARFFWNNRINFKLCEIEKSSGPLLSETQKEQLKEICMELLSLVEASPSPLHGDLWRGNILCGSTQRAWLIDPAFYYGHFETDLAMTECFGGFPEDFYFHYKKVNPLEKGYERRKHLYNLYHMLNHFLIFGESYRAPVLGIFSDLSRSF